MAGRDFSAELFGAEQGRDLSKELFGPAPVPPTPPEGGFLPAVKRGVLQTGMLLGDVLPAMAARAVGADEYAERQLKEAAETQARIQREVPAAVPSFTDISGIGDAWMYAKEAVGESLISIIPSIITGGAAGLLARPAIAAANQAAKEAAERSLMAAALQAGPVKQEVIEKAKKEAIEAGIKAAQSTALKYEATGAFAGSAVQNIPEVYQNVLEETGKESIPAALAFGGFNAALDSVLPVGLLRKMRAEGLSPTETMAAWYKRGAKGLGTGFLVEGGTEAAQETSSIAAENFVAENREFFNSKNLERVINAGLKGGLGGGVITGATDIALGKAPPPEVTDRQKAEQLQREILGDLQVARAEQQLAEEQEAARLKAEAERPPTADEIVSLATKPNGYGELEAVKQRLLMQTRTPETREALDVIREIQGRIIIEEQQRRAPSPPTIPTTDDLFRLAQMPDGYGQLEITKQNLLKQPKTPETQEALDAIKDFQNRLITEQIDRTRQPVKIEMDDKTIRSLGFAKSENPNSVYQQLLGKSPSDPLVIGFLENYANTKAKPQTKERIERFLGQARRYQMPLTAEEVAKGAADARQAITAPSGEGVPVVGKPPAITPAPGVGEAKPTGVVPAEEDVGQPPRREAAAPAPIETPSTERDAVQQHAVKGLPIVEAPLDQVTLSKDVPQFKSEADELGIVKALEGKFERTGVAPIQLWRRTDGRLEVISGRHRFDLAKRSGETTIPAQIHDEAAGFDAKKAATLDAELNIRDEQGEVKDYVVYFEKSGISEDEAKSRGLLGRPVGQRGWAIASKGSPDLIAAHRSGIVPDDAAAGIATAAPGDSRLQAAGIRAAQQGKNTATVVNTVQAVKALAKERGVSQDQAGDLFGFDDSAIREAEEMARVATQKQQEIGSRLAAITGAAKKPEVASKEGIDIRDPEALNKRVQELRQKRAAWNNWSSSPDLIKEIQAAIKGEPPAKPSLPAAAPAPKPLKLSKETEAKIEELGKILERILGKFGLRNVALNIERDLKNNGEYANRLIKLALDADSPVRDLRHESLHAMKELGFFSDAQWKTLEKMARDKWVDKYLKNRPSSYEGQPMSRYDAYMRLYNGNEDLILEEAIADAFSDFDITKPPAGLMQTLLRRMRDLFRGIKEAMGLANIDSAEDIFRRVEKGELREGIVIPAAEASKPSLRQIKDVPEFLYHATYRPLIKSINNNGLGATKITNWEDSKPGVVYLATSPDVAESYAEISENVDENWLNQIVVLKINTVNLNKNKFYLDRNVIDNDGSAIEYHGIIPTREIFTESAAQAAPKPSLRAPETEAFKKWFGNSKVVDENGDPLVVYHGTASDFTEFRRTRSGEFGPAIYTTDSAREAGEYGVGQQQPGVNIMPVYVSIKNPYNKSVDEFWQEFGRDDGDAAAVARAQDAGYDGVIAKRPDVYYDSVTRKFVDQGNTLTHYIAFSPSQIKSATGNIGTYSPTTADIRYSLRAPTTPAFKKWFGDSKIVNPDGTPKVMYHGTARDITEFRPKQAGAIFVTDRPDFAEMFAESSAGWMMLHADQFLSLEQISKGKKGAIKQIKKDYAADPKLAQKLIDALDDPKSMYVPDAAQILAKQFEELMPTGPNLMPLYVRAEDPFDFDNKEHIARINKYERDNRYTERTISYYIGAIESGSWEAIEAKKVQDAIKSLGFDGFYVKEGGVKNLAVYKPSQLKSATGNIGTFDITKPDIRYSLRDSLGLYSELEAKIAQGPNKAPAASWKAYINGLTQKGVKPEEIEWSGVRDWLDLMARPQPVFESGYGLVEEQKGPDGKWTQVDDLGEYFRTKEEAEAAITNDMRLAAEQFGRESDTEGRVAVKRIEKETLNFGKTITPQVTKDQVIAYLKQGGVKVEEVVLGNLPVPRNSIEQRWLEEGPRNASEEDDYQAFIARGGEDAKYSQYTLPGGENYREVLLTLPSKVDEKTQRLLDQERYLVLSPEDQAKVDAAKKKVGVAYQSTHWDQPNVIAHIRLNDRTDTDGNKVLFVEEIQSDWGQEGKKKGFGSTDTSGWTARDNDGDWDVLNAQGEVIATVTSSSAERAIQRAAKQDAAGRLPAAPFVTKTEGWLNLALKRIMVMAAEGGYDKVAFVNGQQSADRYDLSKKVTKIEYASRDSAIQDERAFTVYGLQGEELISKNVAEKELPDLIGKEATERLLAAEPKSLGGRAKFHVISGDGLKVGGEGMKAFYNQIVPIAVKKLLPKVGGGQVGVVGLRTSEPRRPGKPAPKGMEQPGFDVTPDMKRKVETTGLPRFSLREPRLNLRDQLDPATRARMDQTIAPRDEKTFGQRMMEAISPKTYSFFRTQFVNRYDGLSKLDKMKVDMMGGVDMLADAGAESAALLSDLGAGVAASAMGVNDGKGGVPVYKHYFVVEVNNRALAKQYTTRAQAEADAQKVNGVVRERGFTTVVNFDNTIQGPVGIFAPLMAKYKDMDIFQIFQFYSAVKRGARFMYTLDAKGNVIEKLFEPADIQKANALEKQYPELKEVHANWIKYNDKLVDFMRDTGVISKEGAEVFKMHGDYFPFYRQIDEQDDAVGPRIFQSIAAVKAPTKLKGAEARLGDFFENMVRNTQSAIQAGMKNVAARRAAELGQDVKIVFPVGPGQPTSGPEIFHVLENGQRRFYATTDPMMMGAIKSLNLPDMPGIGILAGPANLLRNLVTKDPGFILANLMRDSMSAWATSGVKMTPIADTVANFGKALFTDSKEYKALQAAGVVGGYEFSHNVETSAKAFGGAIRKAAGVPTITQQIARPVTSVWEALEKATGASDAATRMEIYKKTLAETGNEAEAVFRAMEVMNFNRKGSSAIIRILTAAVPFLNARIQGLDILYRAGIAPSFDASATERAKQVQKTFFIRGAMMAALSAMYWAMTHDDEDYKKQEQETRDNYWLLPSLGIKIPIPFEVGVLFKVIPERILGYTMGDDTGKDFLKSMGRQILNTFAFNPIPQAFIPVVETVTNFSFFTWRPILPQGMENVAPEYQVGPGTSKLAEGIGKAIGASPIRIDQLINGYTGTMGMYMVDLMDAIFNTMTDSPKPSKRFEQMPVIRRFAVDPEARGTVTAYYDLKNSVDEVVRTSNLLERTMDYEGYGKYMQENMQMLASREYVLDMEKTLKEFREMKNLIRSSNFSADAKRDYLTTIGQMENALTSNIQQLKKLYQ